MIKYIGKITRYLTDFKPLIREDLIQDRPIFGMQRLARHSALLAW
jgi:hypothetical protein